MVHLPFKLQYYRNCFANAYLIKILIQNVGYQKFKITIKLIVLSYYHILLYLFWKKVSNVLAVSFIYRKNNQLFRASMHWMNLSTKITHILVLFCKSYFEINSLHWKEIQLYPLCWWWLTWPIQNDSKKLKNDWNPGTWALIWEYSVRAI